MEILNLYPGSFASNCYLLLSKGHAAVVDPSENAEQILAAVRESGAVLDFILLTHGHFDHILFLDELRDASGAPAYVHENDAELLPDAQKNAFFYFFHKERTFRPAERTLRDGDTLTLGDATIRVIHTPGHTSGSVSYLCDGSLLLTGDTLFDGNVGRYDLYGADESALYRSLDRLRALPDTLTVYPGHGNEVTLRRAWEHLVLY